MNSAYYTTAIALRDLECDSLKSLDDRILLQKKIYLAQDFGLPLGYGFGWYIHGPYSPDLTQAAFTIIPEGFDAVQERRFTPKYQGIVSCVNSLEAEAERRCVRLAPVAWYELLASVAYWTQRGVTTEKDMVDTLRKYKPQFDEGEVYAAYKAYQETKAQITTT